MISKKSRYCFGTHPRKLVMINEDDASEYRAERNHKRKVDRNARLDERDPHYYYPDSEEVTAAGISDDTEEVEYD